MPKRIIKRVLHMLKHQGLLEFLALAARTMFETAIPPRCRCSGKCRSLILGKRGIEIGGPSRIFAPRGRIPIYNSAYSTDGINYAASTMWANNLSEDSPYEYRGQRLGRQYLREGAALHGIDSESYDFVLSSHAIEHMANPLRVLREWSRVLNDDGLLILVIPHKDATFDHRRRVTTLEHIEQDYCNDVGEDDLSHLREILSLHDSTRDWGAGTPAEFLAKCENNLTTRCLHHHVFDTDLAARLVDRSGFMILAIEPTLPNSIVVVCTKPVPTDAASNAEFLGSDAPWRAASPFVSDRAAYRQPTRTPGDV